MSVAVQDLDCEASAALTARRWTADCLRSQLDDQSAASTLVDDAVLCVSELVTNAIRAGCTSLSVQLQVDDVVVRVMVIDNAPGWPTPRTVGPTERSGRGLRLVAAMSEAWGVDGVVDGEAVWAELPRAKD